MFSPRAVTKASCSRASSSVLPSCSSSIATSGKQLLQRQRRLFSITIQRQASNNNGNTYYVATLPWADKDQDRKERFNELIKNSSFTDNENIVASSITTSKRASPIASSLKAEIERLNTTADKTGGGAWLLLKAATGDEAKSILNETNAGEVFDLERSTLQIVELDQGATGGEGPLYAGSNNSNTSSSSSSSSSSSRDSAATSSSSAVTSDVKESSDNHANDLTSGNVFSQQGSAESAGGKPKKSPSSSSSTSKTPQKKDKTNRKPRENAAEAEESRTGGSAVETSGPLYGK